MPVISCPIPECTYKTVDVDASVAVVLLTIHNNIHAAESAKSTVNLPRISKGCDKNDWDTFKMRWFLYKQDCNLNPEEIVKHLLQCCDEDLGDDILNIFPQGFTGTEEELLGIIKRFAISSATFRRAQLISLKQHNGESVRNFHSRINVMAATCDYTIECCSNTCAERSDLTEVIIKDVFIAGLVNDDIKKEVFEWTELDSKNIDDIICFIESQEQLHHLDVQPNPIVEVSTYQTKNKSKRSMDTTHVYPIDEVTQIDSDGESFLPAGPAKHRKDFHNEKFFKCSLCDESFLRNRDLKEHNKVHIQKGENPYMCDVCLKTFALKDSLVRHLRIYHSAGGVHKPYICKVCNRAFTFNYKLKRHEKVHTDEKPYICEVCGNRFKTKDYLKAHLRVHTGEKPYKCDVCDRSFSQRTNLQTHSRVHSKKSFRCDKCDANFRNKVDLERHNDKYNSENPFTCKMCDASMESCAEKHVCPILKINK